MRNAFSSVETTVDTSMESVFLRLKYNGVSVKQLDEQITGESTESIRGNGLYVISSLLNHTCRPNCQRTAFCNTVAVTCSTDIPAGAPICISYLDSIALTQDRDCRRDILKNWGFDCICIRCAQEEQKQKKEEDLLFNVGTSPEQRNDDDNDDPAERPALEEGL